MGFLRPEIHYSMDDYVHRGMAAAKIEYARIAQLMGGTNLRYTPDGVYANNQHITGTMAMGNDPKDRSSTGLGARMTTKICSLPVLALCRPPQQLTRH